ncbi:MAG: hypothetical protein LH645_07680 [Actinomycetia bacterium]|nr:hypothetical protein [Actinomycetes bacterium]
MAEPTMGEFDFFAPDPPQGARSPEPGPTSLPPSRLGFTPPRELTPVIPGGKASRWAKSDRTFGPVGRIVASLGLLVPFLFLATAGVFTFDPFVLGGAGIWAVLMVVGLRQVWQLVEHHHRH